MKPILFIGALLCSLQSYAHPLHHCYAPFLGYKNANGYYTQLVHEAAADFRYENIIPVKQMNDSARRLIGYDLPAFTMGGIWLNQESLDTCPDIERYWIIYHEVAHYVAGHHSHLISLLSLVSPLISINYSYMQTSWGTIIALISSGLLSYRLKRYAIQPFVKAQAKEADLMVLRLFFKNKKFTLINEYLDHLRMLLEFGKGDESNGWHHSFQEQFEYLNGTYISLLAVIPNNSRE